MSEEEQCNRCGNMAHFMPGGNPKSSESAQTVGCKTVFVLEACADYEGCSIYKIYSSKEKAEAEKSKLELLEEEYLAECVKTDYETEMKRPDCCNEDLYIKEFEVL